MTQMTTRQIVGFIAFAVIILIKVWFLYIFIRGHIKEFLFEKHWKKKKERFF